MILLLLYEAMRLGLNVKGTLAIIKKMMVDGKIKIDDLEPFYQRLLQIKFQGYFILKRDKTCSRSNCHLRCA